MKTGRPDFAVLCLSWLLGAAWLASLPPAQGEVSSRAQSDAAAAAFFASAELTVFQVDLGPAEYDQLARSPRTYVRGKVTAGGRVFEDVGVRLKGTGTFQSIAQRPNLALKFNWKLPEQEFEGLTKLFLKNSLQDPSFLCEFAASAAFTDAGVPTPRITHARVRLNGRELGLCVLAEAVNKRFLRRHFQNAQGNLYEGAFRDIGAKLEQDNGKRGDRGDLTGLAVAAQSSRAGRHEALAKVLDVDKFLNFLAVEMMVANWDGYALHQNNYRIYHDSVTERLCFIPHGLDNTLFETGLPLMPPRKSVLAAALLETAEDREVFRQRVAGLLPQVFNLERACARVTAEAAKMKQGAC